MSALAMSWSTLPSPPADRARQLAAVARLARSMPVASAELLTERALQRRRDWKYLLPLSSLSDLVERLGETHAVLWAGDAVLARYDTQYFDTAARSCFHAHRCGRSRRYKVRVRTYPDRHLTMLEVKQRTGRGRTAKERLPVSYGQTGLDPIDYTFVAAHAPVSVPSLRPTIANRFLRLTLLGVHAAERVTFDLDLGFSDPAGEARLPSVVVAEVKTAASRSQTEALSVFADAGLRPRRLSKYCVGTVLLHPDVRANRFRPVLRDLARLEDR